MKTTPKTIGNLIFDRLALQLAVNGTYRSDGTPDASISLVLTPLAVTESGVVMAEHSSTQMLRGHISEITDPAEIKAVTSIQAALQEFIDNKGI